MEQRQTLGGVPISMQEPVDIGQVATVVRQLLDEGLAEEAVARFSRLRPADQADVMAQLAREAQVELLSRLTARSLGMIIEELEPTDVVELSQDMGPGQLSRALDEASPDVAADVLRELPEEVASSTLQQMREARGVVPLLGYEDDDAGGLMTPEFIALREDMTVSQALAFAQRWAEDLEPEDISYLFVVDHDGVLKGGVSLAQLVLAKPFQLISLFTDPDIISVTPQTDQEQCARLMQRYNLHNLPVVADGGKLVGVVKLTGMMDVFEDEATEDMYRIFGVGEIERPLGPFWQSVRSRLPWLGVFLGTATLPVLIITLFQSTLSQAVALAAFMPMIAGQGGIAGTQALTLVVRSLALGEIGPGDALRLLAKEIALGLVHGLALGILVGVIALVWKGNEYLALVVALAMAANLVVASVTGILVPLTLRALRIDPALASAVFVTTCTDAVGFLVYLGLATLAIGRITGSL